MGTLFIECSAKANIGVGDIFEDLVRKVSIHFILYDHSQQPDSREAGTMVKKSSEG
jgi:hypothetical protein